MGLMKNAKRRILIFIALGIVAVNLGDCVYANNKDWDDLTAKEQEEIRQEFESIKEEPEEVFGKRYYSEK